MTVLIPNSERPRVQVFLSIEEGKHGVMHVTISNEGREVSLSNFHYKIIKNAIARFTFQNEAAMERWIAE